MNYTIQKMEHRWLITGRLPLDEIQMITQGMPSGCYLHPGISGKYRTAMCIGLPEELKLWEGEIEESVKGLKPQERFLRGTKVGISALSIFTALTDNASLRREAENYYETEFHPDVSKDADDFSRCQYLLSLMPEWKSRLREVSERFPKTRWKEIAPQWQILEHFYLKGKPQAVSTILAGLNATVEIVSPSRE